MQLLTPTGYKDITALAPGDEVCAFDSGGAPIVNTIEKIDRWELLPSDADIFAWDQTTGEQIGPQGTGPEQWKWYSVNGGAYMLFGEQSVWRLRPAEATENVCHARDLAVGDTLFDDHDAAFTISTIAEADGPSAWYRLEISGDHSFIADGLSLHNASRFWVGGTGTWDLSTTTHWASSSGGAGGQSAPGSADTVTIDGSSGAGTVTPQYGGSGTFQTLTCGAMGMTLDYSVNNDNATFTGSGGISGTGTGTRTLNLGSGTFTISTTTNASIPWAFTTTTNLTFNAGTSIIDFTGALSAGSGQTFIGGGKTYATVRVSGSRLNSGLLISGANTFSTLANTAVASITINSATTITTISSSAQLILSIPNGATLTVTNAATFTGTASAPCAIINGATGVTTAAATYSTASGTVSGTWVAIQGTTFTGGATFSFTNSLDLGHNTGATITAPGPSQGVLFRQDLSGGCFG